MNLSWDIKYDINWYLRDLEQRSGNLVVREFLKIILDESRTEEDFVNEIFRLHLIKNAPAPAEQKGNYFVNIFRDVLDAIKIVIYKFTSNAIELQPEQISGQTIEATNLYGICYQYGIGVAQNETRAFEHFECAAHKGCAFAQTHLAFLYMDGVGITKDSRRAIEYLKLASNQGHALAHNLLGFCYDNGIGVAKDKKSAVELYNRAVQQGYAPAQVNLGMCYEFGNGGLDINTKRAVELYQHAAKQECPTAQCKLGLCCLNGVGIDKNEKHAIEFFERSATQGNADAQNVLGFFYQKGINVEKDLKRAVNAYSSQNEQRFSSESERLFSFNVNMDSRLM